MKEELILKVKPETLDSLMNALVDITSEMKAAAPDQQVRFGDEVYMTCLCLENTVLGAIRQVELKKKEGKEIAGQLAARKDGQGRQARPESW